VLSPHTVQNHVKNLFEKMGVASRQELVARVFLDEYLPEVAQHTPSPHRDASIGTDDDLMARWRLTTPCDGALRHPA
jgi:hypothetical protein